MEHDITVRNRVAAIEQTHLVEYERLTGTGNLKAANGTLLQIIRNLLSLHLLHGAPPAASPPEDSIAQKLHDEATQFEVDVTQWQPSQARAKLTETIDALNDTADAALAQARQESAEAADDTAGVAPPDGPLEAPTTVAERPTEHPHAVAGDEQIAATEAAGDSDDKGVKRKRKT